MKGISTTIQKLNKDYKPLSVAVFLAIGGLLSGLLWHSLFVSRPAGIVQERRVQGGPSLIAQAEGAEIDSAALATQSAPFLASADAGTGNAHLVQDTDILYGEGAIKDPGQAIKFNAVATSNPAKKSLASSVIYTVVAGDTIQSISAAFGIPMNTIVEFNPSVNFSSLIPGATIMIPGQNDVLLLEG